MFLNNQCISLQHAIIYIRSTMKMFTKCIILSERGAVVYCLSPRTSHISMHIRSSVFLLCSILGGGDSTAGLLRKHLHISPISPYQAWLVLILKNWVNFMVADVRAYCGACISTLTARFMGPTRGPSGADRMGMFIYSSLGESRHEGTVVILLHNYPYPEPVYTGWSSVYWNATGMPLVAQCTLGYHWATQRILAGYNGTPLEKLSWNSPHWNATRETLTFAAYTGTPLEGGLWQPTQAPTHIVKYTE